jgi:hypothetical protein
MRVWNFQNDLSGDYNNLRDFVWYQRLKPLIIEDYLIQVGFLFRPKQGLLEQCIEIKVFDALYTVLR